MELYIQDLTLFTITRGHRDTWESRDGNNNEEERLFFLEQRPRRGALCFFTLYFMHLFIFRCACGHPEAINRQRLPTVIVPFLKLLHNIWLSLISHIHLFISSFSSAQFRCFTCLVFLLQMTKIALIIFEYLL